MIFPPAKLDLQPRLEASSQAFALVFLRVPGLTAHLRVQLLALPLRASKCYSLYVRYMDGARPLEYVTAFKPLPGQNRGMGAMLLDAVQSHSFEARVLRPFLERLK